MRVKKVCFAITEKCKIILDSILFSQLTKMKEVRLKERIEKAVQAFFDDERFDNDSLNLTNYETPANLEKKPFFSETSKTVFNVFRQVFLFLPGTFVLFFMSIVFTGFLFLRPFGGGRRGFLPALLIFLATALMTVVGLGDWRNPKHYSIPLSIISIGVILGIVGSLFFGDYGLFGNFLRNYVPYFIPLAFIAPVLVKGWVDKTEE